MLGAGLGRRDVLTALRGRRPRHAVTRRAVRCSHTAARAETTTTGPEGERQGGHPDRSGQARRTTRPGAGGAGRTVPSVDVLVVDDDEGVRQTVAEILRRAQHTVAEAENGERALDCLGELRVGVMVVDVRMPRLDGLGLLRLLENPPPAVVISAYYVDEEVRRALGTKVSAYLRKPFRPEHLLEAVTRALGGSATS